MPGPCDARYEERVLVAMPSSRDAERAAQLLAEAGVACTICPRLADVRRELPHGAGAVLITDDVMLGDRSRELESALREQPPWSAVPILVLAREARGERVQYGAPEVFSNIVVVERPVRTRSLLSVVQSALRARRNQYHIRDALLERERQATELAAQGRQLRAALAALEASQSELARRAEQLRTADQLKDEFLATLAHELRNPLAPIRTGLSLLSEDPDPELRSKTLGVMQRQLAHMVRLIDDLLDVSRITRGKLELKREPVALSSVVEEAVEASLPAIQRRQHRLETELSADAIVLDVDRTRMAQVIGNLLNNASKYTPIGGVIRLSARRAGDVAEISVRDNGLGIPEERLGDVFEMFSQINRELARSEGGLGIGLALVRRLVEMHGGEVSAESAGPGRGSTFTVRLPCTLTKALASEPAAKGADSEPARQRIVVVDDNEDAADLLASMLARAGHETITVHDGASAIEVVTAERPDLVILDIGLPGMNGYEVAQRVRTDPKIANIGLIALTGWGTQEDRRRAKAAGFDVHLTKPVTAVDLRAALHRAVQARRQLAP